MLFVALIIALFCAFFQSSCWADDEPKLAVEMRRASSGNQYRLIDARTSKIGFEIKRPAQSDPNVLLCIPAAFTSKDGGLCGLFACKGSLGNEGLIDLAMSGACEIKNGSCRIFDTNNGAELKAAYLSKLKEDKCSFFQQFQVVKDRKAESFKDKSIRQRRCVAILSDARLEIIESDDAISFNEFGNDLVEFGVQDAIYTDMGPWSEGWYRDSKSGEPVTIGNSRLSTKKQTNWVVLKKNLDE